MIALTGGIVADPASGFFGRADVIVTGGRVAAVTPGGGKVPPGVTTIEVSGLVVGPGFVDLHSHVHSIAGQRLQAMDGVTTALDLEAGLMPVDRAYAEAARAGRPLHYGFSASWGAARALVLGGVQPDASTESVMRALADPAVQRSSSKAELADLLGELERELTAGALGIGVLQGYAPQADPREFLAVARLAKSAGTPTYTHVRELIEADPATPIDGSEEIVRAAAETGAAMHHCHVNSTSRRHIDRVLALLEKSRSEGASVTVEAYPYGAGSTSVGAVFLDPDRLVRWGLSPSSIIMLETGQRVSSAAELRHIRQADPGAGCVVEFLDERRAADLALLRRSLAFEDAVVASDAGGVKWPGGVGDTLEWPLPPGGTTHPRTAGTFAKTARTMVRESGLWSWLELFRRCSYLPARLLETATPAARGKGYLGPGADADLIALDPGTITDAATYRDPTRPSAGVRLLLVAGTPVIENGELNTAVLPGRPVRGEPK